MKGFTPLEKKFGVGSKNRSKSLTGFTIFFAMLVGGLALAIGVAIYDLTVRELDLSGTATQSQYAIYAADTGAECALYWDLKCSLNPYCTGGAAGSAFATSSQSVTPPSGILCNSVDVAPTVVSTLTAATTTFTVTFLPQPYCASVTVAKSGIPTQTTITSKGYNAACPPAAVGTTRLERALQVSY